MQRRREEEPSQYTGEQIKLIKVYHSIGLGLAEKMPKYPDLIKELSGVMHGPPPVRYVDVLDHYFHRSGRGLYALVEGPIIEAFRESPLCSGEEQAFFEAIKESQASVSVAPGYIHAGFNQWLKSRESVLVKGFQRFVLDTEIIPPYTADEVVELIRSTRRTWIENNRGRFEELQRKAACAAGESAEPKIFTPEIRKQIQSWFHRGLDYKTVAELLEGKGVYVSPGRLRSVVSEYGDLEYTPKRREEEARKGFGLAAKEIFELSGSKSKTYAILRLLGYSEAKTRWTLERMGVYERVRKDTRLSSEETDAEKEA